MALLVVALVTLILNIPFGYWRTHVRKFSVYWFAAVHLMVPVVIVMRVFAGIHYSFIYFCVVPPAYFIGQFIGGMIYSKRPLNVDA